MSEIKIGNKIIGEDYPCFIVAEIGMNHNGNVELATSQANSCRKG